MLPNISFAPQNMTVTQPAPTMQTYGPSAGEVSTRPGEPIRVRSSIVNMPADWEASGPAAWSTADLNKPAIQPEQKSGGLFALLALAAAAMTFGG